MIYTIGHSTHSIENFIKLLKSRGITAIADVRSSPYSRFQPQFNRELLTKSLVIQLAVGHPMKTIMKMEESFIVD